MRYTVETNKSHFPVKLFFRKNYFSQKREIPAPAHLSMNWVDAHAAHHYNLLFNVVDVQKKTIDEPVIIDISAKVSRYVEIKAKIQKTD